MGVISFVPINKHQNLISFSSIISVSKYSSLSSLCASLQLYSSSSSSFGFLHASPPSSFSHSSSHLCFSSAFIFLLFHSRHSIYCWAVTHYCSPTWLSTSDPHVTCSIFSLFKTYFHSSLFNSSLCSLFRCSSSNLINSTSFLSVFFLIHLCSCALCLKHELLLFLPLFLVVC